MFKNKFNGKHRGRLNTHGFKQVEGVYHNKDDVAAPIANEVTTRVAIVIMTVLKVCAGLLDVKGAFLPG